MKVFSKNFSNIKNEKIKEKFIVNHDLLIVISMFKSLIKLDKNEEINTILNRICRRKIITSRYYYISQIYFSDRERY